MKLFQSIALVTIFCACASVAGASIIINDNQSGSGSLGIVLLPGDDLDSMIITGDRGGTDVIFEGNELLVSPSGGQATIRATDGSFTWLAIYLESGFVFDRLVFNLDAESDGEIEFTATDDQGNIFVEIRPLDQNGQNFFSIDSDALQQISRVEFTTTVGVTITELDQIRQVRVGGISELGNQPPDVPEPGTLISVGAGLIALGVWRHRAKVTQA